MYYIVKQGIYDHGVMWIGEDLEEGKAKADYLASNNDDGYHNYVIMDFVEPSPSNLMSDWDEGSKEVYTGKRINGGNNG